MNLLHIATAVVIVDFVTLALHRTFNFGRSLTKWYEQFGIVAVLSDCLVIILGILLAKFLVPDADVYILTAVSVVVQLVHDYLFYIGVILPIPRGHNAMIDLFKDYANENSYKILLADSLMIGSSVVLADFLSGLRPKYVEFAGLLAAYALTFIIYTR